MVVDEKLWRTIDLLLQMHEEAMLEEELLIYGDGFGDLRSQDFRLVMKVIEGRDVDEVVARLVKRSLEYRRVP